MENLELERVCPIHQKPLRQFKGIGKTSGKPYENWKCTYKDDSGYCSVIEWVDQEPTKKFTQTPNGVIESESPFPTDVSTLGDVMASLGRLHAKVNKLLNGTEND